MSMCWRCLGRHDCQYRTVWDRNGAECHLANKDRPPRTFDQILNSHEELERADAIAKLKHGPTKWGKHEAYLARIEDPRDRERARGNGGDTSAESHEGYCR